MDKRAMCLRRIASVDLALYELTLYLDTHPEDQNALRMREIYQNKRRELIAEYEAAFGPYVVTTDDVRGDRWTWVDNPWPWDFGKEG